MSGLAADRAVLATLPATPFRPGRDVIIGALLVGAVVASLVAAIIVGGGLPVLFLLAATAVLAAWANSFVEVWAVGPGWISHRRLLGTDTLRASDVRSIEILDNDVRPDQLLVLGPGWRGIALPVRDIGHHPDFAGAVRRFVAETESAQPDVAVDDRARTVLSLTG